MKSLYKTLLEKTVKQDFDVINQMLSEAYGSGVENSPTSKEEETENANWRNRHHVRDGHVLHDVFVKDHSGTLYKYIRNFFKNWFKLNADFDLTKGVRCGELKTVPATTNQLSMIIQGTPPKPTHRDKSGMDSKYSKGVEQKNESLSVYEAEEAKQEGTGFPAAKALMDSGNKYAKDKENGIAVYMDDEQHPCGLSIIAKADNKSLAAFREECNDEKYKECPHIWLLEFITHFNEKQKLEVFEKYVKGDIAKAFEIKGKPKQEMQDDKAPKADSHTITISYLSPEYKAFYEKLGFVEYDKKNQLMALEF